MLSGLAFFVTQAKQRRGGAGSIFHRTRALHAGLCELAGVDEAGRGPLAGPVVAAAVVLPEEWATDGIPDSLKRLNDSKQLSESVREELYEAIPSQ